MRQFLVASLVLTLHLSSYAQNGEIKSLRPFFFPIDSFFVPKVYLYVDTANNTNNQYWFMKSLIEDSDTFLITEAYNHQFEQFEFFKEKITVKGSEVYEFHIYYFNQPIHSKINTRDIFIWDTNQSSEYSWSVNYDSPKGKTDFMKQRTYIGLEKNIEIFGKKVTAIRFRDIFSVKTNEPSRFGFHQYSYYAEGIGMIGYDRYFSGRKNVKLRLDKVISEIEWQELLNKS